MSDQRLKHIGTDDLLREIKHRAKSQENIKTIKKSEWIDILDDYPERGELVIVLAEDFEGRRLIDFAEWDPYCWTYPDWVDQSGNLLELPDGFKIRAWLPIPRIPIRSAGPKNGSTIMPLSGSLKIHNPKGE